MAKKHNSFFEEYTKIIFTIILIILIFTFFDFLIHQLSEQYSVPSYYFRNKIIFGTFIGIAAYLLLRNKKLIGKSIGFSAIIAILLQTRYFIEGYSLKFVIVFLFIHFFVLLIVSYLVFRLLKL